MRLKISFLLLFFSIHFFGQEYSGKGEDVSMILQNIKNFSEAYMEEDFNKLASFYCEDGKIFPDGVDIIEGYAAIEARWTLPKGVDIISHKVTPKEINVLENYAYDYGYYQGSSSNKKKEISEFKGKYVIVWKKVDNNWKIYLDIWNKIK